MTQRAKRRPEPDAAPVRVLFHGLRAARGIHLTLRALRDSGSGGVRFRRLDRATSKFDIHEWSIMDRFASDADSEIRAELRDSLRGSGAFQRFKDAVYRLTVEGAWFAYRTRALEDLARRWLADHGLEARA